MKFALNGALTIGTLDGANIEIRERVGAENFFLFGLTAPEVIALKAGGYNPLDYYAHPRARGRSMRSPRAGSRGATGGFSPNRRFLLYHDDYMLLADYASYVRQDPIERRPTAIADGWARMSILNAARCGFFSSDRAIRQYTEEIWRVKPVRM